MDILSSFRFSLTKQTLVEIEDVVFDVPGTGDAPLRDENIRGREHVPSGVQVDSDTLLARRHVNTTRAAS